MTSCRPNLSLDSGTAFTATGGYTQDNICVEASLSERIQDQVSLPLDSSVAVSPPRGADTQIIGNPQILDEVHGKEPRS